MNTLLESKKIKKIIILNSYTLSDRDAYSMVRIKYFFKGLREEGYLIGNNLDVELIDSNDLMVIESTLRRKKKDNLDLIHAVGTPNAAIAAKFTGDIPVVYYGAHPEDVGSEECKKNNSCGVILTLPFTRNYKSFRFLKKLIPGIERVYVPFYEKTIFCHKKMKENYRVFRSRNKSITWQPMDSEYIGYKSLASLCYIIGIEYFEFLYRDIDELLTLLELAEPGGSLIMPYNDSVYCKDAPNVLIKSSSKRKIPLLWNNNPEATQVGALAAVAGCFKESGYVNGKMAGKILKGAHPSAMGYQMSTKSFASINLKSAKLFGLEFSEKILEYFDEIITDQV